MKKCNKCNKNKDVGDFYSGRGECKECTKTNRRKYYINNTCACRKAMKKYENNNSKMLRKKRKERYELNKDKKIEYEKRYYQSNKQAILRRENEYNKRRYKNDTEFRLRKALRQRLYQALNGNGKTSSVLDNLGCTVEELKSHLESKFQPGMTWDNHGKDGWHIDHIVPLASFNLSDFDELKKACHYTNLQPLWAKDNLRKGARLDHSP